LLPNSRVRVEESGLGRAEGADAGREGFSDHCCVRFFVARRFPGMVLTNSYRRGGEERPNFFF
jgi:hypothetical protein